MPKDATKDARRGGDHPCSQHPPSWPQPIGDVDMGGENPSRIDAGCGGVPTSLSDCGQGGCRNRKAQESAGRDSPMKR